MTSDAATVGKQRLTTLAESVSFAVVVDRPLLRAARLKFVPDADASLEADFWFAPLIRTRAADGVTLLSDAADELRKSVAKDPQRLQDVWKLTSEMHAHLPETLKLEEEIAYLSVSSGEAAVQRIEMLLRSALAAMVDGGRDQLANWSARLLANLPTSVRLLPAARLLDAGARLRLGGDASRVESNDLELVSWLTPSTLPRDHIGVRFTATGLTFEASPEPRGEKMAVPRTRPLLLRTSWTSRDGETQSAQVTIRRGEEASLDVSANEVTVTTLTGESYLLRRSGSTPESVASAIIDFSELIARKSSVELLGREQALAMIHEVIEFGSRKVTTSESAVIVTGTPSSGKTTGSIVMLTGAPGSGKTTLLARVATDLNAAGTACFAHFFEPGTPRHEDHELARRSLIAQMISRFDLPPSMMSMPFDAFIRAVPGATMAEVPIVIILDNVDAVRGIEAFEIMRPFQDLPVPFNVIASAGRDLKISDISLRIRTDISEESSLASVTGERKPGDLFGVVDIVQSARAGGNLKITSMADAFEQEAAWSSSTSRFLFALALARGPLPSANGRVLADRYGFSELPRSVFLSSLPHNGEASMTIVNDAGREFLRGMTSDAERDRVHADLGAVVAPVDAPAPEFSWYGLMHGPFHWWQAGRDDIALDQVSRADLLQARIAMYGARITSNYIEEIVLNTKNIQREALAFLVSAMRRIEAHLDAAPEELVPLLYPRLRDAGLGDDDISRRMFSVPDEALPKLRVVRREKGKGSGYRLPARVSRLRAFPRQTFLAALEDHSLLLFQPFDNVSSPILLGSHPERITAITGGTDWAVSGSADGLLSFWNVSRPHLKFQLTAHQAEIVEVVAGKDRCFSCDAEGTVIAWRMKRGAADQADRWEKVWTKNLDAPVTAASFSVKNQAIVIGCRDGTMIAFNLDGSLLMSAERQRGPVVTMATYGSFVISADSDRVLRMTVVESGELVAEVQTGHAMGIAGIAVSQLGRMVVTWSADQTARVFATNLSRALKPLAVLSPHRAGITAAAFVGNDTLLTCSTDGTAVVSRVDGTEVFRFQEHDAPIRACAVAWPVKMNPIVITASDDRQILVWTGRTGLVRSEPSPAVTRIGAVLGGGTLILRGEDVEIRTHTSKRVVKGAHFAVSPESDEFVIAEGRRISFYRGGSGFFRPIRTFTAIEPAALLAVQSGTVVAATASGHVDLYDYTSGTRERHSQHHGRITVIQPTMELSWGGARTGGIDGEVWQTTVDRRHMHHLGSHNARVTALGASRSGGFFLSAAEDGSLILCGLGGIELARGRSNVVRIRHITSQNAAFYCAGDDGAIESFGFSDLHPIARFEAHTDAVTGMCIDSDHNLLFTASADATIRAWEGERLIATYYGDVPFTALALVDGEIVAGDESGGLLWLSFGPPRTAPAQKPAHKRLSSARLKKPVRKRVEPTRKRVGSDAQREAKRLVGSRVQKAAKRLSGDALPGTLRPISVSKRPGNLKKK